MLVIRSLFQMEALSPVMDAAGLDFVILPRSLSRSGASLLISDTSGIGSPLLLRGLAHPGMLILLAGTLRSGSLPPACDLVFPGLGLPLRSFSCLGFPVSVVSAHVPGSFPPLQAFFCAGSFVPPAGVARLGLLPPVSAGAAPGALLPPRSFAQPGAQTLRARPPLPSLPTCFMKTSWWKLRKSALPATRPGLASPVLALADLESPPLPQARPGEQPLQERLFMSRLRLQVPPGHGAIDLRICTGRAPASGSGSPAVSASAFARSPLQAEPGAPVKIGLFTVLAKSCTPRCHCCGDAVSARRQTQTKKGAVLCISRSECLRGPPTSPRALARSGLRPVLQSVVRSPALLCAVSDASCFFFRNARPCQAHPGFTSAVLELSSLDFPLSSLGCSIRKVACLQMCLQCLATLVRWAQKGSLVGKNGFDRSQLAICPGLAWVSLARRVEAMKCRVFAGPPTTASGKNMPGSSLVASDCTSLESFLPLKRPGMRAKPTVGC